MERATRLAYRMVAEWGLDEQLGMISTAALDVPVSERRLREIEDGVKRILEEGLEISRGLVRKNEEVVRRLSDRLMVDETLLEDRLIEFWRENPTAAS